MFSKIEAFLNSSSSENQANSVKPEAKTKQNKKKLTKANNIVQNQNCIYFPVSEQLHVTTA